MTVTAFAIKQVKLSSSTWDAPGQAWGRRTHLSQLSNGFIYSVSIYSIVLDLAHLALTNFWIFPLSVSWFIIFLL